MATSLIEELDENMNFIREEEEDNLYEIIFDFAREIRERLVALEKYYVEKGDETIELISRLNGMYQMSGINILEEYLTEIAYDTKLDILLRLEAGKALLSYKELEDEVEEGDTKEEIIEKEEENERVKIRNNKRMENSGRVLNELCLYASSLPTPCRVETIFALMGIEKWEVEANKYFIELINDQEIECKFRYTTIVSLERKCVEYSKEILEKYFNDKEFVAELFTEYLDLITKEFPDYSPSIENKKFFEFLLGRLNYDFAMKMLKKYTNKECCYETFLFNAQLEFLKCVENMTYYKVLAGQYLLQKFDSNREEVEGYLLAIAQDAELDYDRRADAADVLLQLGSPMMKVRGRNIIMELGGVEGRVRTVFDNAQNVHVTEVEESVAEVLEFFAMMVVNKENIDYDYVKEQVDGILKEMKENMDDDEYKEREKRVGVALTRINLDRALYSKYNSTLSNILIKVWCYLSGHDNEEEMRKRLIEELEEMSGTCSTGFASRLINVISGFGEFNIRISWEDQIVANFAGRLNAAARKITEENSIFKKEKLEDMMKLWFNTRERLSLKDSITKKLQKSKFITENPTLKDVVDEYLSEERESKVDQVLDYFAANVLNEMALPSSSTDERLHFSLFFRTYVAYIREEMYAEFKEYLDDTSFDLYMRKAMMHYEGI